MDFWTLLALSQAGKAIRKASDNSLLHFKGSVLTYDDLPDDAEQGDVYHVDEDGAEYAWTGEAWESLGPIIVVDDALSDTSENPVQNKVITAALGLKANASSLANKLDKDQGSDNAGKFLLVGNDGKITLVTMQAWQGGSY